MLDLLLADVSGGMHSGMPSSYLLVYIAHMMFLILFFYSEYLSAKQEVDQLRQRQSRLRSDRDVSIAKFEQRSSFCWPCSLLTF